MRNHKFQVDEETKIVPERENPKKGNTCRMKVQTEGAKSGEMVRTRIAENESELGAES